jgi:exosortase
VTTLRAPAKTAGPSPLRASDVATAVVALGALAWSYAPSFAALVGQWNRDPNYSYGYFVIPISLVILWSRRGLLDRDRLAPRWYGFIPLLAVAALRYLLFEWNEQYVETATIPVVVAGLALALGGWHLVRVALPSIFFLFFMLPLPPSFNLVLAGPLQKLATNGSVMMLQLVGLPVMAEGNVILVGQETLEVARACNGLSMLLAFVTLLTATVILLHRPFLEGALLLISAIPIALISNILRITITGMVYHWAGHVAGETLAHDWAGWMMMPMALGLVWLECQVYSWLFVEVEEVAASDVLRRKKRSRRGG